MPRSEVPSESTESDFSQVWHPVDEVGRGGGATIYRCINRQFMEIIEAFSLQSSVSTQPEATRRSTFARFIDEINSRLILLGDGVAAVKVPFRENSIELQRFNREIQAMKICKHPAFIRLLGHGPLDEISWFAMEYHPHGNLGDHVEKYKGKPLECLLAMRPVIECAALLHNAGFIHRDIKAKNIFVSARGSLVLGDLGIVYPTSTAERLTEQATVLISRDWVPDWGRFTDDPPQPKFDVYMLAMVMYYMVTGGRNVLASQLGRPQNDIEVMFPGAKGTKEFKSLLTECLVTNEDACEFDNASALLNRVDRAIDVISGRGRTELLFTWLSNHSTTDLAIRQAGNESNSYPSLRDIPIFVPFPCKRMIMQTRIADPGPVSIGLVIDNLRPLAMLDGGRYPSDYRGVWSSEIRLDFEIPIDRGWHTLKFVVTSLNSGRLTGVVLYAE